MRTNHLRSCLAVSDESHVFRIRKLLEHEGVTVLWRPGRIPGRILNRSVPWRCCARRPVIYFGGCIFQPKLSPAHFPSQLGNVRHMMAAVPGIESQTLFERHNS